MSDRYQHRLQIYHFTVGRLFLHLIYIKYYQEPSAIGAALTCPGLTRYDLLVAHLPAYIRSDSIRFYGTLEWI